MASIGESSGTALKNPPAHESDSSNGTETLHDTVQLRTLLDVLQRVRGGDFSIRMPSDQLGLSGKVADTLNDIIDANARMAQQLERVGQVVGREGKTKQRVKFGLPGGAWGEMESSVNTLIDDLLRPTTEVKPLPQPGGDLMQTVQLMSTAA
jgi:hypothetical protein